MKKRGFTLIELLIAISIFAVVSIGIYSVFSGGITVFSKVKNTDLAQQRLLLNVERFARELRQQPPCRRNLFSGSNERLSFSSFLDYSPARTTYYFDRARNAFMRAVERQSDIISPEGSIDPEVKVKDATPALGNIKDARFYYLFLDLQKNDYVWLEEWPYDHLPVAIKAVIRDESREYTKTVFLPLA
ncbi:MAG: prepilin-type N-terminal cleavage/methylation domain-containing protein [Candidatus Omnitrophota bacterium]|jgi:prepilin-type N-terminal cleavage/methylation domain-containing protein